MKIVRRLVTLIAAVILLTGKSSAQIQITPTPPPDVGEKILTIAGWILWLLQVAFGVVMAYGILKIIQGERREDTMYLIGCAIGLAVVASINSIISALTI